MRRIFIAWRARMAEKERVRERLENNARAAQQESLEEKKRAENNARVMAESRRIAEQIMREEGI